MIPLEHHGRAQQQLEEDGFAVVRSAIDEAARDRFLSLLRPERIEGAVKHRSGIVFASRHLLAHLPELARRLRRSATG